MDPQQLFDTFNFHHKLTVKQQIDPIPTIEGYILVPDGQPNLQLKRDLGSA
jgi:hypothetical protein